MTVGENIRRIREEKGYTQKQLSEKCKMYESQIRKYELGKAKPKIETLRKIADALNVPLPFILPWEEYQQTEEYKQNERHTHSTYAIVKILEELYKRAEIINVDAYNNGELEYSSNYLSLGIEPNKIFIKGDDFDLLCDQIRQVLKSFIALVSKKENEALIQWLNESDIDELQTSELEHVVIQIKDNEKNEKYIKPKELKGQTSTATPSDTE